MPAPYMASSLPPHEVAELQRLMAVEIREVAVFFMDADGIITVWTRAAEDMKGYTVEDAIGQHLAMLYTEEDRKRGWPQHNLQAARDQGYYQEESWRQRKDGSLFWARITLTALFDETHTLLGFSKITLDLTDHKLLEQCTAEREQTQRVMRAAHAGTWTWHPDTDRIETSSDLLCLLGHTDAHPDMTLAQWLILVHPDQQAHVAAAFSQGHANLPKTPLAMEAQMRLKDGSYRWFSIRAGWHRETEDEPYTLSGVNVDVQDVKTAEAELRQAVAKLTEADARKDEFLAMLAHELRNPLAPIRAAAELLKIPRLDAARVRQTSHIIARQVDHMTGLVDDLLDVSRVTKGLVDLERTALDIRHIVTEAVEQAHPLIQSRRQHLALDVSPDAATVMGDRKRLVQVLSNLLHNAAKYTREGGHIVLRTEVSEDRVVIAVADDGIGMEPELASRVFDLFAQAKRTPDRSSGGLGLGLALVRSLVQLHGGTVSGFSAGHGKGSTFAVDLPLASVPAEPISPASDAGSTATAKSLRVLVVDDNVDAAQMLGMLLEALGHTVTVEYGAHQALERSRNERPDVCVLDIGLPEIDGNALALRLKAQPETARTTLIALTGYGQRYDRENALAAGFSYYFVKPVDMTTLLAVLDRIDHGTLPQ